MGVQSPGKALEAHALAIGLDSVGTRIAAGEFKSTIRKLTDAKILGAIQASNTAALGASKSFWQGFATTMGLSLKMVYDNNKLATDADWIALLSEASLGLKAVK